MIRHDGFLPIGDYAAIGAGQTVALVGRDGVIDWLPLPTFSDPSVFGAILDRDRGGSFTLAPATSFESQRRYLPDTNVLETTFTTADGSVRVTDAMNVGAIGILPGTELVRRIEGLSGSVPMRWRMEPRFEYGQEDATVDRRGGVPVASHGDVRIGVLSFGAGDPDCRDQSIEGEATISAGERAMLAIVASSRAPMLYPSRHELEERLDQTIELWRRWVDGCTYDGPWRDATRRSLLALKLLVYEPTGAIVAAPTTSLPERVGGERNYDYRFAWVRDLSFTLDAVLRFGMREQAHRSFTWLLDATASSHPRLLPIYGITGRPPGGQSELGLEGYRGSRPVNSGNGAARQTQLGNYGDLLETAFLYVDRGATLDHRSGLRLAQVADVVCAVWRNADSGIWELGDRRHYTLSKMACWVALDRACRLAERGELPDGRARWRREADAIRRYVLERCWSGEHGAFMRDAGSDELDAGPLLAARMDFVEPGDPRMSGTIDAVRRELGVAGGPLLYRYSGMQDEEGAFVACSFWMAEALARDSRTDDAAEVIDGMLAYANDVGLMSEEIDPASGELRGNFPQGLSHLALLNAVALYDEATGQAPSPAVAWEGTGSRQS